MTSRKKTARIAGLMYFILVLSGIFSLMYVPSKIMVWDDPAATVANIKASETLFRLGILGSLICYLSFMVLPLILYKLLNTVNKNHAQLMVVLVLVSIPISFVNIIDKIDVLTLLGDATYLSGYTTEQAHAQIMLSLESYYAGINLVQIFWGLWLFPFGYLVYKSGFLPKILGIFLMLGCLGYIIEFIGNFLFPTYGGSLFSTIVGIPASIGEIGICLWLLIIGVWEKRST